MSQKVDVCIIGAGAAGLAAANALDPRLRICLIDKNEIPGRKILAAGGGRCNLTNAACSRHQETLDFFRGLGLETAADEEGRYYPYSGCAADVAEALVNRLAGRDVCWILPAEVISVDPEHVKATEAQDQTEGEDGPCFRVSWVRRSGKKGLPEDILPGAAPFGSESEVIADRVILCTGGKAAPVFGTTGDGYRLARSLGHGVSRVYPILTGIRCLLPKQLAGIRARGIVRLLEDGVCIAKETGQIQFTPEGLSGICIFDLTLHIRLREGEKPADGFARYQVEVDLAPDFAAEEVVRRASSFGIVTRKLAEAVPPEKLKCWRLPVERVWGWDKAQCTAGGVEREQINPETMESLLCPGLFFAGELLDRQGPCGGYNLQNAWETGLRAAREISRRTADSCRCMSGAGQQTTER